jgi:HEPN domain-containing protein
MLNEKCKKYSRDFSSLDSAVDILNAYYTDTRYPDIWDYNRFNDRELAKEALEQAKKVLDLISQKLSC